MKYVEKAENQVVCSFHP